MTDANENQMRAGAGTVEKFDVIILGAGINGAGLFRDLCLQDVKCLIVDKADFGSGTSAAPSRLIHGGIKYLETGELGLVAQSTLERNLLLRNAPHCVEPLPTFIPSFSLMKGAFAAIRTLFGSTTAPRSRGAILIKIGLALYDLYGARHRVMPKHQFMFRKRALAEMPEVTPRIVAGGIYYDAKISRPERLVWELVRDGLDASPGSRAANFTSLLGQQDGVLTFRDPQGAEWQASGGVAVNAAGPWIDHVNATLGAESKLIGGTKGSHILLSHPELVKSLKGRMIYFEADDGRICLVYEYLGLALVGSTDIKAADPENVRCEDDEIDYFIASLRSLLPRLRFDRDQIVYAYSGIRPLPASDASQPGLISRDHSAPVIEPVESRPFAIISLVGGKWTTFRGFAEEVADTILARIGKARAKSTQMLAIGGGRDFPIDDATRKTWIAGRATSTGLAPQRIAVLLARYGTTADPVMNHICDGAGDAELTHVPGYSVAEIDWIARTEMVEHLADIVMRRTTLAIEGRLSAEALDEISRVAAAELGWSEEKRTEEVAAVSAHLQRFNRVHL
ncbi:MULTISPECIES: glycerol-3-phosphate dehydrogenase/oxidase [unclassified Rhizobium]|uniref:glycerol-3-phosphate dehydrogenase/oxidase n=1 Tax=unclassified Rhizobium TaxID=2613769 RepID=UPI0007136ED3|nr:MULTISPECIES: glycerol-3-phosphate dehydrogenase/oxidase [unclassified Rhizobium]KQS83619.1 glycerol-3-phosphate dehydrogenase [Rhizobium sp. Leaf386]KQT03860.1 glycerol-3-phosphate dehydrogenase [Rhizobium sp. Leaf391]KQU03712.1 glycerol-3-phosphate dehydrogenase [Rhizobium sp. Leaf453]